MTFTQTNAYLAVLENKLIQAERELNEFRQIFTHFTRQLGDGPLPSPLVLRPRDLSSMEEPVGSGPDHSETVLAETGIGPDKNGLFPGQSAPPHDGLADDPPQPEEKMQACYIEEPECVE